jgi:DNA-binding IclR family transcriptional regulator
MWVGTLAPIFDPFRTPDMTANEFQGLTGKGQEAPRSINRILRLLDCLGQSHAGASLTELAQELEMPKSSLLVLLRGLQESHHVTTKDRKYWLGMAAFDLGLRLLSARPGSEVMRQGMRELWEKSQETAVITTIDHAQHIVTYQDAMESVLSVRYTVQLGRTRPLYCTAAGQALLAFQDEGYREHYLRTVKLVQQTESTITDVGLLREKLARVREEGLAVSVAEAIRNSIGVAAPIRRKDGTVEQALLVAGPADRMEERLAALRPVVLDVAARVSALMAHAN